jgi:hypothetical protein
MSTIETDGKLDFSQVVGICPAPRWGANLGGWNKEVLFWVVTRDGQMFGVVHGQSGPKVAEVGPNFQGYVAPGEKTANGPVF